MSLTGMNRPSAEKTARSPRGGDGDECDNRRAGSQSLMPLPCSMVATVFPSAENESENTDWFAASVPVLTQSPVAMSHSLTSPGEGAGGDGLTVRRNRQALESSDLTSIMPSSRASARLQIQRVLTGIE